MWWTIGLSIAAIYAVHWLGIAKWTTTAIAIAILYGFSKLTGIQMGEVLTLAIGLFLLIGVIVDITEWIKHRRSPYYNPGGEQDDGE